MGSAAPAPSPGLFERAVSILRERYYDKDFREQKLPEIAAKLRPPSTDAPSAMQRQSLHELLSQVPASHLGLLSEASFNYLIAELAGEARPTFGFHALRLGQDYFSFFVLEGGPAADAGVLPWERIVSIDGLPVAESPRLDEAQKDAYLSVDRDPPIHSILGEEGEEISFCLERKPGEQRIVKVRNRRYSAVAAARASAHLIECEGQKLGYVHFWFIHASGVVETLRDLFAGPFRDAQGLILDLRGRGGNGAAIDDLLDTLRRWRRPIVALTDRQSRSAKDVLAYEFKQRHLATVVGERTAGAVIPASFAPLGDNAVLMFPSFTLGDYTARLELKGGVEPDIFVERAGPYSNGEDPILIRGVAELHQLIEKAGPTQLKVEPTPAAALSSETTTDLPKIDDLIAKMAEVLGGEKAIREHEHRTLRGTAELVGLPMKGEFLQKASAPDKSFVEMHLGDLIVKQGFDGVTAWSQTPMTGKQVLEGAAAETMSQQARFYGPLDLRASVKEISLVAVVTFDQKPCFELRLVTAHGVVSYLYVDRTTYLTAGSKADVDTPVGKVETKTYFRNFRLFSDFKTPTEIYSESSLQKLRIMVDQVTFEPIPVAEYSLPASK